MRKPPVAKILRDARQEWVDANKRLKDEFSAVVGTNAPRMQMEKYKAQAAEAKEYFQELCATYADVIVAALGDKP